MSKASSHLVSCILFVSFFIPVQSVSQTPPTARAWLGGAVVNNSFYAVGGGNGCCAGFGGGELSTAETYDSAGNLWSTDPSLPTARFGLAASSANGKIFALGGTFSYFSTPLSTVEAFDPISGTWSYRTGMSIPRWKLTSSNVNGIIYAIGGGSTGNQCVGTGAVEAYDPAADVWTTKTSMPTARYGAASDAINGLIYVVGGLPSVACPAIPTGSLEIYDPSTDTWSSGGPMPTPRTDLAAVALNGKLYAIGGWDPQTQTALSTVEVFDPLLGSWSTKAPMPTARSGLATVVINGKIYAFGGIDQSTQVLSTLEVYDALTDNWSKISGMPGISVSPTQITFPPTLINTRSAPVTITVSNPASAILSISDISTHSPFAILNYSSNIVSGIVPNTSGSFDVIFSPTGAGPYSDSVSITSNAASSPTSISLLGTVITAGAITVSTNTPSATFTISGPLSFSGSGTSATFSNAPPGTYTIVYGPECRSDLPANQTQILLAGNTINFIGSYQPGFLEVFPLIGQSACTAKINSVFDHSAPYQYCADNKVIAYTDDTGDQQPTSFVLSTSCSAKKEGKKLFGFSQAGQVPFVLHGQYLGAGTPQFLFYDGHPGYDYQAACHDPVLAAVSGTIRYPSSIEGLGANTGKQYHILEIVPDSPNQSYRVIYLHLATYPTNYCPSCSCAPLPATVSDGQHVNKGDVIGEVGNAGTPKPHLHFEIQVMGLPSDPSGVPVDPYGWQSTNADPYSPRATNVNLWK